MEGCGGRGLKEEYLDMKWEVEKQGGGTKWRG